MVLALKSMQQVQSRCLQRALISSSHPSCHNNHKYDVHKWVLSCTGLQLTHYHPVHTT